MHSHHRIAPLCLHVRCLLILCASEVGDSGGLRLVLGDDFSAVSALELAGSCFTELDVALLSGEALLSYRMVL